MGIFGGEKYSKEGYEEAEAEAKSTSRRYNKIGSLAGGGLYDTLIIDAFAARKRVGKMYAKGKTEAAALHKEYGRLLAEAQEAVKAVADFEREKLGMHKDSVEEEADADKK